METSAFVRRIQSNIIALEKLHTLESGDKLIQIKLDYDVLEFEIQKYGWFNRWNRLFADLYSKTCQVLGRLLLHVKITEEFFSDNNASKHSEHVYNLRNKQQQLIQSVLPCLFVLRQTYTSWISNPVLLDAVVQDYKKYISNETKTVSSSVIESTNNTSSVSSSSSSSIVTVSSSSSIATMSSFSSSSIATVSSSSSSSISTVSSTELAAAFTTSSSSQPFTSSESSSSSQLSTSSPSSESSSLSSPSSSSSSSSSPSSSSSSSSVSLPSCYITTTACSPPLAQTNENKKYEPITITSSPSEVSITINTNDKTYHHLPPIYSPSSATKDSSPPSARRWEIKAFNTLPQLTKKPPLAPLPRNK